MQKVLYVDDEQLNLQLFNLNFRKHYHVITSSEPEESLRTIQNERIQVVITDYKMPEMNGVEFIDRIKEANPEVICILLSGYSPSDVVITDRSKIFGHLTKPINKIEVLETLEKAFGTICVPCL